MEAEQLLSPAQRRVFDFLHSYIEKHGFAPSIREVAKSLRIRSPNGIARHLDVLERKGYIQRAANKARSIQLVDGARPQPTEFPLAGIVSAGALMEAIPGDERIDVSALFNNSRDYLLRVQGSSMIDAHIRDGDYVVVRPSKSANPGDIAVVQTDEFEATVKYWFPEKKRVRLQPANKRMKPIYTTRANVLGIVVGVIRKY